MPEKWSSKWQDRRARQMQAQNLSPSLVGSLLPGLVSLNGKGTGPWTPDGRFDTPTIPVLSQSNVERRALSIIRRLNPLPFLVLHPSGFSSQEVCEGSETLGTSFKVLRSTFDAPCLGAHHVR